MTNPFLGVSKTTLQSLLLSRLASLSNFRKECRYYKQRLLDARDEQRMTRVEIGQIEFALQQHKLVLFPAPVLASEEEEIPILETRVFGRWGSVSFKAIQPPVNVSRSKTG